MGKILPPSIRVDKWLWAARFFKTRQIAAEAVRGGHVDVNGGRAKPSRLVSPGDRILVHKNPYRYDIVVLAVNDRRVSAKQAQTLYRESEASVEARTLLSVQLKSQAQQVLFDARRPSARDRRNARRRKRE